MKMKKILLMLGFILLMPACSTTTPPPSSAPRARLEFRPAQYTAAPGFAERVEKGSDRKVYVSDQVLLSNEHVASAWVGKTELGPNVEIKLTRDGKQALAEATEANVNKAIAILVDGDVLSAPLVRQKISGGRATISGVFTEEEARRIADGIRK
jgi:preprotein translocase subunit SecD